jgi:ribosomal protein L11 methyltransferase
MTKPEAWLARITCARAEVDAIEAQLATLDQFGGPPTVSSFELRDEWNTPWTVEAYFLEQPNIDGLEAEISPVWPQDWITLSQQGLPPIRAGRFFVHTAAHAHEKPPGKIGLRIEAGQAFGTGQHYTTHGCLEMLDHLAKAARPRNVLDLGCGTGILGFAAAKGWGASVTLSDIDAVAVRFAVAAGRANTLMPPRARFVTAAGLRHPHLQAKAPYDLIIANILAGPLVTMAPEISRAVRPGGWLMLAGLLDSQERRVSSAYQMRGFAKAKRLQRQDWPTLLLRKRG